MLTALLNLQPLFQPISCQIDFEIATKNAFLHVFPGVEILGCFFHLEQSLWRKVQGVGLREGYIDDENVRKHVQMLMALAFVPIDEIYHAFGDLTDSPNFPAVLEPVTDYFEDIYLGRMDYLWSKFKNQWDERVERFPEIFDALEQWKGEKKRLIV